MRNNRFQNHVSESSLTLPLCVALATGLWFLPIGSQELWASVLSWVLAVLSGYVVLETNTAFSIIRIRTRMMSTTWFAVVAVSVFMHTDVAACIIALFTAITLYLMFGCYQEREPVLRVFHIFLLVGIEAMFQPILILQALLFYWYLLVFMRSLTWRCFWAGILGLLLPFWLTLGWCILVDDYSQMTYLTENLNPLKTICAENYMGFSIRNLALWAGITLISMVSLMNFLHNYYNDKIKTRMLLYIYVMHTIVFWAILVLQPQMFDILMPVVIVGVTPLIAHFFCLTGSIPSNLFFCFSLLILIGLGVLCFMPERLLTPALVSKLLSQISHLNWIHF